MRHMILECAKRCRRDTNMRRAFLRALGIEVPTAKRVTIRVDDYSDIADCFANRERVRL